MKQHSNSPAQFGELFDFDNSHLPLPFAGETLYSWCARFHRINGNTSARLTSRQLFGDSTAGLRHDFPTHLNTLLARTNQLFGSIDELIYQRTVFGIFSPFLTASAIRSITENMCEGGNVHIKYHLGVLPSRVGSAAPLKSCPSCIRREAMSSGTSWWHVEHQWPTGRVCQAHGDYLLMPAQELHSRVLKEWFLPADIQWHTDVAPNERALIKLHKLNEWSNFLATRSRNPFDNDLLRLTYHIRAKTMGWTSMDGSLKFSQIRATFRENYACLEELTGFEFIGETRQEHGGFLGSLLRQFDGNKHPLKHALIMDFLFDKPEQFISEYERILSISVWLDRKELWSELTVERNQLKLLVGELGYSVNAASKQLGLPIGQSLRFLKIEGVEYKRRPRVLNQQTESKLRTLLEAGDDRETIASALNIRKSFIKDYLSHDTSLRDTWQKANHAKKTEEYRSQFLQLLNEHPNVSLKKLKQIPGNGIQWLVRNDKQWLEKILPSLWKHHSPMPGTT